MMDIVRWGQGVMNYDPYRSAIVGTLVGGECFIGSNGRAMLRCTGIIHYTPSPLHPRPISHDNVHCREFGACDVEFQRMIQSGIN